MFNKMECLECFKIFPDPNILNDHTCCLHEECRDNQECVKYKCSICSKSYKNRAGLQEHIKAKHTGRGELAVNFTFKNIFKIFLNCTFT